MLVDGPPLAAIAIAILLAAERPGAMGLVVLSALAVRFALGRALLGWRGRALATEALFFAACTLVGGFNDYNTVVLRGVYAYTVPAELPAVSTIPLWMLLTWGFVLRFVTTLAGWRRLGGGHVTDDVRLLGRRRSVPARLAVMAALVLATRLVTFTYATHVWLSFVPYLLALAVAAVVLVPSRREARLVALALIIGPIVEALFIRIGRLHHYELGWLFGVPLWIVLWWALGAWLWGDVSNRLLVWLSVPREARAR